MNLSFRPADASDLEPLDTLNEQLIRQYEDLSLSALPEVLAWVRRKLQKKLTEYLAVWLDGVKAGYFRLCDGENGTLEIDDLYVLSSQQGKGVGSEIVKYCIEESTRQQKPLMLYVFTGNLPAVRLYEKMGFELKETVSPTRQILIRLPDKP